MRKRTVILAVVVVALAGGGAYVAHRLTQGGKVTEVGVDRAVEQFREQVSTTTVPPSTTVSPSTTTSPATTTSPSTTFVEVAAASTERDPPTTTAPEPALPALGVYAYTTTGYDAVDVLNGARHDYPAVSTITVIPSGCGVRLRWDVAEERWDSWDWCLDGAAVRLVGWTGYHEFFGVGGSNDYVCSGDPRPLDAEPGTTWEMVCRAGDHDTSSYRGTVLERTTLVVGGSSVPALHVRYEVDVVGVSTGTETIERWYRTTDGLLLRQILVTDTEQDTAVGTSGFEERSTIELLSLTPES